jgi:hypothetical protein
MDEVISVLGRNLGSALIGFALGRRAGARTLQRFIGQMFAGQRFAGQRFAGVSLDRFMALIGGGPEGNANGDEAGAPGRATAINLSVCVLTTKRDGESD